MLVVVNDCLGQRKAYLKAALIFGKRRGGEKLPKEWMLCHPEDRKQQCQPNQVVEP